MYIYGKNASLEYLNSNKKINKIILQNNFNDEKIKNKIKEENISIKVLTKQEMDKIESGLHQGIILDVEEYEYGKLETILNLDSALIIMLDHIEDPHNLGAIIRTAEAAGVDAVIIPSDRCADINSTVIKVSVGTALNVLIIKVTNLVNTIKILKQNGYWIFGTDMNGEDYTKLDYKGKSVIICGNEGKGLSKLVRDNCDFIASIPMKGKVNSLNASVATAIITFEAVKMRG